MLASAPAAYPSSRRQCESSDCSSWFSITTLAPVPTCWARMSTRPASPGSVTSVRASSRCSSSPSRPMFLASHGVKLLVSFGQASRRLTGSSGCISGISLLPNPGPEIRCCTSLPVQRRRPCREKTLRAVAGHSGPMVHTSGPETSSPVVTMMVTSCPLTSAAMNGIVSPSRVIWPVRRRDPRRTFEWLTSKQARLRGD